MPWFKVDDTLAMHTKVVRAGNAAMGLWVRAGAWSAQQLTDGHIPREMIAPLGGRPADAQRLVDAGLWDEADDGWTFHQWHERQPSREKVESTRAAEAERKRLGRERARQRREAEASGERPAGQPQDVQPDKSRSPARPDPTRPDPTQTTKPPAGAQSAQTLVGEWIDACQQRPPKRIVGQVAREVGALLDEGIPYADVRNGLRSWHAKRLHPSTIPSEVHAARLGPATASPRASTTDQRVQAGLDLAAQYRAAEEAQARAIGASQ